MKFSLEYIFNENGTKFLNFWNWFDGDDVVCEIIDNKIMLDGEKEITISELFAMIEERGNYINSQLSKDSEDSKH